MKKRKIIEYFSTCEEHYPLSDKFVRKYQQNKGESPEKDSGYIGLAYSLGLQINAEKAEPNQKWHLLVAYYGTNKKDFDIHDKELDKNASIWALGSLETGKGGPGLKCPELLLWIAEATGCDIQEAELAAESLCEKGERLLACNAIKQCISWKEIESRINEFETDDL